MTHQTLCAIEYVIRSYFSGDTITTCSNAKIIASVVDDADVQFHWNLASSQMDEDVSEKLLEKVANKWLGIREHSFAKSILERYKRETKQSVQKKKPLRTVLSTIEADDSDTNE